MSNRRLALAAALAIAAAPIVAAQSVLDRAVVRERPGAVLPGDVPLTNSAGDRTSTAAMFGGRPVLLTFAYFSCPMLCPTVVDELAGALSRTALALGRDYRVVTVSIDPHDTAATAREWRARAADRLGLPAANLGWDFYTGTEADVRRLSAAVGFQYAFDAASGQYAHPAGLVLVDSSGKVKQYIAGASFDARELERAIRAADAAGIPIASEPFLVRCFHYIPALRRHQGVVTWTLRTGGALVLVSIAALIGTLVRRDRRSSP